MLVLTRYAKESVVLMVDERIPETMTVRQFFNGQPVIVTVLATGESFARLGFSAPAGLRILREELMPPEEPEE